MTEGTGGLFVPPAWLVTEYEDKYAQYGAALPELDPVEYDDDYCPYCGHER